MVTLDEAMFAFVNRNGQRKICYSREGQEIPPDWVVEKDNFLKSFMVVGAISGRGSIPLTRVHNKVKVSAYYYISQVLRPMTETHLPRLYPGELHKVTIHHDKASSHTALKTQRYCEEVKAKFRLTFVKNAEIPVKSPDPSPMDVLGFGFLKRNLLRRRPR